MTISQFIKKLSTTFAGTAFAALSATTAAQAISITPTSSGNDLVNEILGSGITIAPDSINYTGTAGASGIFTDGLLSGIGIDSGIILTTGTAKDAEGPNESDEQTTENQLPGDSDLDGLIPGFTTEDATILEFDFESEGGDLYFNYVFASEEYVEWTHTDFNDVFGFFLNGENIALIPGTSTPVAINTVNGGNPLLGTKASNPEFFNNNDLTDGGPFFDIEYDGFTNVFTAQALGLSAGTHHIRLAIADAGDAKLDSAVFIQANSFSDTRTDVPDSPSTEDVSDPQPIESDIPTDVPDSPLTEDVPAPQPIESDMPTDVPDSPLTEDVPAPQSPEDVPEPSVLIGLLIVGFAGSWLKKNINKV